VNQVFEILVKWVETRNWEEALCSVIPKRKFVDGGNIKKDGVEEVELDGEEEIKLGSGSINEGAGSGGQNASTQIVFHKNI